MNRMHVHVSVGNLGAARRFYSALFGAEPSVDKPDYAKWMLDDPRVNFAISQAQGDAPGINHLGIQAETAEELEQLHARLANARYETMEETGAK